MKFEYVEFFIDRFDNDFVQLEFLRYQVELLPECVLSCEHADVAWHHISQLRYNNSKHKFKELAAVVKGILVIPHSTADSEILFSCVRKNRT